MANKIVPQSGILDVQGSILQNGKPLVVKDDALVFSDYRILASAAIDTSIEPKVVSIDVSALAYDITTGLIKAKTLSSLSTQEILGVAYSSVSSGNSATLITRGVITSTLTGVTVGESVYATATGTLSLTLSAKRIGYILTTGANAKVFVDIHTQNTGYIQDLVLGAATIPTGIVAPFPGAVAPVGWLLCDGTSYLTATYPDLFAIIAYNYGGTLGNFNVPDYQGMFLRGAGSQTVGGIPYSGAMLHGTQNDAFQGHRHSPLGGFGAYLVGPNLTSPGGGNISASNTAASTGSADTSDGVNGTPRTASETRPVSYGVNWIIKT